jgi:hypothetical protein
VDPDDDFALPGEWQPFTATEAGEVPALADLQLARFLLQEGADPFVGDYNAWLSAVTSIDGPQSTRINGVAADLYVLELPLAEAPDLIENRFRSLSEGEDTVVDRRALLANLDENGTVLWGVALDPASGRLVAQYVQLELAADLAGDTLTSPYDTMTLAFNEFQEVVFSAVNEPVDPSDLPALD